MTQRRMLDFVVVKGRETKPIKADEIDLTEKKGLFVYLRMK